MNADIVFRGMEPTEAIEQYVAKNLYKFKKYLGKQDPHATFIHVVLEGQLKHAIYNVEIRVKTPEFDLVARREGTDMYPLIDEVSHIMESELEKAKGKSLDDYKDPDKRKIRL